MNIERDTTWQARTDRVAWGIRKRVLEHTIKSNGGYLSQACSSAEILATLYVEIMKLGPSQSAAIPPPFRGVPSKDNPHPLTGAAFNGPHAPELDRFFLSPAHYALAVYAALIEVERMAPEGLAMFNQDGSTVEMIGAEHSPGMEVTSGSLGQTLSQAAGVALARRLNGDSGRVWVFMSDGEFQSGQTWEAMQALAFYRLDHVGIYVDVNGQQCDGKMDEVMKIEPLFDRLAAFGARVSRVNGHDVDALRAASDYLPDGRPLVVLAYTNPCQGLDLLEARRPKLHYVRFQNEAERKEFAAALSEMLGHKAKTFGRGLTRINADKRIE
ncbi:MAG: transketolase [Chloroflexi bacterium]|nr:transketolase [Chloroflexota bacterium]